MLSASLNKTFLSFFLPVGLRATGDRGHRAAGLRGAAERPTARARVGRGGGGGGGGGARPLRAAPESQAVPRAAGRRKRKNHIRHRLRKRRLRGHRSQEVPSPQNENKEMAQTSR